MGFVPPIVALNIAQSDMQRMPENVALADADFDWVRFDVADGNFVPRLTFGPPMLALARRFSQATFDVHLMTTRPERHVTALRASGANVVSVHPGATEAPRELLRAIRAEGMRAGVVLGPQADFESVRRFLPDVDVVTVLTTGLEYESHEFLSGMLARVRAAREMRDREKLPYLVQVDGGLTLSTVASAREAGADVYVVGPAIFATPDPGYTLAMFRAAVRGEALLADSPDGVTHATPAPPPAWVRPSTHIFGRRRAA